MKFLSFFLSLFLSFQLFAQSKKTVAVEPFTKIEFAGNGELFLSVGEEPSLTIHAFDDGFFKEYKTTVEDDVLYITSKGNRAHKLAKKIIVYITYQDLEAISLSGKVNLKTTEMPITCKNLDISAEGFIRGQVEIVAEQLEVDIEGFAAFHILGKTDIAKFYLEGAGKINAENLVVNQAKADIEGFGKINVHAKEELDASIEGFSKINYSGDPKEVKVDKHGLGKVTKIN